MKYAKIKKCDVANGPGVRVSLFVTGCNHHCKNCFNRETTYATPNISMKNGFLFCGWEDIESGKI